MYTASEYEGHSIVILHGTQKTVILHGKTDFTWGTKDFVFQWTKHSKLHEWVYKELGRSCVLVGYSTQIRLNRIFEHIMPSRVLHVKIHKKVCVRGDTLEETVELTDVLLIDTMNIKIRAEIDQATESLLMHAHSDIEVPWFLQVFESTIVS
jgi:hypothetical protein